MKKIEFKKKTHYARYKDDIHRVVVPVSACSTQIVTKEPYVDDTTGRVMYETVTRVDDPREYLGKLRVSDFSMQNLIACGAAGQLKPVSMAFDSLSSIAHLTDCAERLTNRIMNNSNSN